MIFYCINLHHASIIHIVYIFFSFFRFLPLVLLWHVIPIWSQLIPTCPIGLVPSLRSSLARCLIVGRLLWFCLSSLSSFSGINPHFFLGSYFSVCQADCCSWKLPFLRQTKLRISSCLQDVLQMLRNHRRAGTYSKEFVDDVGTTWICVQCPLGSAQPYGASLACEPCSFGTYQDELGHLSNNCWYLSSRQLCDFSIF